MREIRAAIDVPTRRALCRGRCKEFPPLDAVDGTLSQTLRETGVVLLPAEIDICNQDQVTAQESTR